MKKIAACILVTFFLLPFSSFAEGGHVECHNTKANAAEKQAAEKQIADVFNSSNQEEGSAFDSGAIDGSGEPE